MMLNAGIIADTPQLSTTSSLTNLVRPQSHHFRGKPKSADHSPPEGPEGPPRAIANSKCQQVINWWSEFTFGIFRVFLSKFSGEKRVRFQRTAATVWACVVRVTRNLVTVAGMRIAVLMCFRFWGVEFDCRCDYVREIDGYSKTRWMFGEYQSIDFVQFDEKICSY